MAQTMQFDLVSPERKLASVEALSVQIPGSEGDMTALPDHAALVTTLRPGILEVATENEITEYIVTGGFAEISDTGVTVLAEFAVKKADVTKDQLQAFIDEAEADLEGAEGPERDEAARRSADYHELLSRHGA
ncbi:MAG: F0F1 ATP synthase subunit epsilon [Paracoccaceae bacterium]